MKEEQAARDWRAAFGASSSAAAPCRPAVGASTHPTPFIETPVNSSLAKIGSGAEVTRSQTIFPRGMHASEDVYR